MGNDLLEGCEKETSKQFIKDMIDADLEDRLRYYQGRYSWEGPAVAVDDLQDALSYTKVKCQWDQLGKGYIVYPVEPERRSSFL